MSESKILIAGHKGQLARALVATAPTGRLRIIALGRPELDLTDQASVRSVIDRVNPSLIINAAAFTRVDEAETDEAAAFALNASAAGFLAEAAAQLNAPILHLSTDYVFDGQKPAPYTETDPVAPLGAYGRSKRAGEIAVAAANPQHLIFRTAWIYSPYGQNFVKTMLRVARTRDELGVVHDQTGNPTSAADIAAALWQIVGQILSETPRFTPGLYNMAGTGDATWAEFAEEIFRISTSAGGPSARVRRITSAEYPTPTRRPANSRLDGTKLLAEFGLVLPQWQLSARACVQGLVASQGWES